MSLRRRLAERHAVGDVARERCEIGVVLAVDGRLLVVQVVVEDRLRRRRHCRLHRRVRDDREREVVVRLIAALQLRHRVVHRGLHVRHVDHAVGLHLRRCRRTHRIHRVRVPRQHRIRWHRRGLPRRRRRHRQRRGRGHC